jgi:hypothetical protein
MNRKRVIRIVLIVIGVFFVMGLLSNTALRWSAVKAIGKIPPMMAPHGVKVEHVYFNRARMEGLTRCVLTDLRTLVKMGDAAGTLKARFQAGILEIDILNFREKEIVFRLKNFNLAFQETKDGQQLPFTQLENATWERKIPVSLSDLPAAVKDILSGANMLFTHNRVGRPFHFEGDVIIKIDDKSARARLFSMEKDGYTTLRFDAADINAAAKTMDIPLVPAEIEIVSNYPLRAIALMEITHTAKKTARNTVITRATVPQDAYRHVLWSYLLTRRFGPEFARQVTDAHETAPGNTPAEREMDYANNAVGRRYATEGVQTAALLDQLLADPAVIKKPGDVG